jgi:hypothetical protein
MKKLIAGLILVSFVVIGLSACSGRQGCPAMSDNYKYSGRNRGVWR